MKVIIDIPEHVKADFDNANIADVDCYVNDYDLLIGRAIKNGTPLDNATNGDVIKALFDGEYGTNGNMVMVWGNRQSVSFTLDWWNAPYTKEQK